MPDEWPRFGRFGRRDEFPSCGTEGHRPEDGCRRCASRALRPFRVVRRYRGDKQAAAFVTADWCDVWQIQAGDMSWPNSRRG